MKRLTACIAATAFALAAIPVAAQAQDVTGSISGTVSGAVGGLGVDASTGVDANANVNTRRDQRHHNKQQHHNRNAGVNAHASANTDSKAEIRRRNAHLNTGIDGAFGANVQSD